jgi:hypothetical protein
MKRLLHCLLFILLFCYIFLIFFHSDSSITEDLGRHLVLGKIIWTQKSIPKNNLFSYTYPNFPFINHHWGSEVIFYLVDTIGSINGLIIMKVGILFFALILLIYDSLKRIHNPISVVGCSILTLELVGNRSDIRPEIFGNLFFVLFLIILYSQKEKKDAKIFLLPAFLLCWVNLHISFIFGIGLYVIYLIDRFIFKKISRNEIIVLFILLLVTLINPNGIQGALYPAKIFSNYGYTIVENQSLFYLENIFQIPTFLYFKISFVLMVLLSILLLVKKRFFEIGTSLFFGILSFMAVRNFPFFALSFLYPMSYGLNFYFIRIKKLSKHIDKKYITPGEIGVLVVLIFILIKATYGLFSNTYYKSIYSGVKTGLGQVKGGKESIDFFIAHHLKGPIYNNFDMGSYLIYRLYPQELVFVDGRPEAYPSDFFTSEYIPMQEKEEKWKQEMEKWKFQTIIYSHTDLTPWGGQFIRRILKDPNWKMVYFDHYVVVFVRKDDVQYASFYLDTPEKIERYIQPKLLQYDSISDLGNLGKFLDTLGLPQLADVVYKRLSKIM